LPGYGTKGGLFDPPNIKTVVWNGA
jgi:hypothetical protein